MRDALNKLFHFLFGTPDRDARDLIQIPSEPVVRYKRLSAGEILGPVKHQKIYVFSITDNGRVFSSCAVCKDPEVTVFSDGIDVLGQRCRMCLRCLEIFSGVEEVERAAKRSKYAMRWLECVRALKKLKDEFPDPEHRPYGTKSLTMEIKRPCWGFQDIERILMKVATNKWTYVDLIAIEKGQAEAQAILAKLHPDERDESTDPVA
jgi:hypothetical protein